MERFASAEDSKAIEARAEWADLGVAQTLFERLELTARDHADLPAVSFQLTSSPRDRGETLTWSEYRNQVAQAANLFRSYGIGENDVVALVLPNCTEMAVALAGAAVAGIVAPINPLLEEKQIAAILRDCAATVVVTMKSFPRSEVAQKVAAALEDAPDVRTVFEVDLRRYVPAPKSWLIPFLRPKLAARHASRVLDFNAEMGRQPKALAFTDAAGDRVAAYFHTGGTTGMPKVAQHRYSGMIYNGWVGATLLFQPGDNVICPLPLFHVFAAHVILMSMIYSGAHVILPTPAGYRGDGVFDNFWKLIERWKVTFIITVPTAIAALMQRPVDADVSTVKTAFSGSAPLPVKLFQRFEEASGVNIIEGYGLTEATCLVSCNPLDGEKRIGSVGIPFPYTDLRILRCDADGNVTHECGTDEVGEICIASPGVYVGNTYTDPTMNKGLFANGTHVRTGDLGRIDADGYIWITGRAKDLIIRGGHNIDPATIEEALARHPAVAMAGAIGQPDAFAGELPCAYVELVAGQTASADELREFAQDHIHERAAMPKYVEVLPELPKTAVGKVFKPDLRRLAIRRVYDAALAEAGLAAEVSEVVEDKKHGLVARLVPTGEVDREEVAKVLGHFTRPFEWA